MNAQTYSSLRFDITGEGEHGVTDDGRSALILPAIDLDALPFSPEAVVGEVEWASGDSASTAVFTLESSITGNQWATVATWAAGSGIKANTDISALNRRFLRARLSTVQATVTERPLVNVHIRVRGQP